MNIVQIGLYKVAGKSPTSNPDVKQGYRSMLHNRFLASLETSGLDKHI